MTLPTTGSLSLSQVRGEHGGSLPLSMSSLLRGNASNIVHSSNNAIPNAPPLLLSSFRGTSRSGNYPITVARWVNGTGYQQGVNINVSGGGSLSYNNYYKGYNISAIAWNEEVDGLIAVGFSQMNVPQSLITSLTTSRVGTRTVTGYSGDFLGTSIFLFGTASVTPFSTAGTLDSSIIIF